MRADRPPDRSLFLEQQLWVAWELVRQRSQAAGIDGMTVELFAGVVSEQIRRLHKQLCSETYAASPAKGFYLAKKDGGRRLIGISTVCDRILQRHVLQAIYPTLDRALSPPPTPTVLGTQPTWQLSGQLRRIDRNLSGC